MFRGNGPCSSRLRSSTWGFAFSKIQNNTFSKLCPPSKGNLLMGHFSERLTQNEIYFPNFHQYSLRNENYNASQGRIYIGGGCRRCTPSPEVTCGFLIQLVFCKKKTMWFIGVEVEQETSAPPLKKNPGSAPASLNHRHDTSSDKWPWSAVILYAY